MKQSPSGPQQITSLILASSSILYAMKKRRRRTNVAVHGQLLHKVAGGLFRRAVLLVGHGFVVGWALALDTKIGDLGHGK
jgi:hypothetical protein